MFYRQKNKRPCLISYTSVYTKLLHFENDQRGQNNLSNKGLMNYIEIHELLLHLVIAIF